MGCTSGFAKIKKKPPPPAPRSLPPKAPFERAVIPTGLCVEIPDGFYGRIAPRSGLAVKSGIDVMAGVIDSGYRGEVGVVLINLAPQAYVNAADITLDPSSSFLISPGDRIAQLIIERCYPAEWISKKLIERKQKEHKKDLAARGYDHRLPYNNVRHSPTLICVAGDRCVCRIRQAAQAK